VPLRFVLCAQLGHEMCHNSSYTATTSASGVFLLGGAPTSHEPAGMWLMICRCSPALVGCCSSLHQRCLSTDRHSPCSCTSASGCVHVDADRQIMCLVC
jgi:hypothetical protein